MNAPQQQTPLAWTTMISRVDALTRSVSHRGTAMNPEGLQESAGPHATSGGETVHALHLSALS